MLEGHEELVRCIRFDSKRIVSGAYDGKIKVWDLAAALDPRAPAGTLCLRTLVVSSALVWSGGGPSHWGSWPPDDSVSGTVAGAQRSGVPAPVR